jgi:hypothetical protein
LETALIKQKYWTYYSTQTDRRDHWSDVEFTTKQDIFADEL